MQGPLSTPFLFCLLLLLEYRHNSKRPSHKLRSMIEESNSHLALIRKSCSLFCFQRTLNNAFGIYTCMGTACDSVRQAPWKPKQASISTCDSKDLIKWIVNMSSSYSRSAFHHQFAGALVKNNELAELHGKKLSKFNRETANRGQIHPTGEKASRHRGRQALFLHDKPSDLSLRVISPSSLGHPIADFRSEWVQIPVSSGEQPVSAEKHRSNQRKPPRYSQKAGKQSLPSAERSDNPI